MVSFYYKTILKLIKKNADVLILTADNGLSEYMMFHNLFPDRFINFGISEANMISYAAGLASCGKIPYTFAISTFLTMRAYEQIRNDVCLQKMNVKIIGIGGGMEFGEVGASHHSIEDICIMRVLPGMKVICPASNIEAKAAILASESIEGPIYIRLQQSSEEIFCKNYTFAIGKGIQLEYGRDITLISTGTIIHDVLYIVKILKEQGISCGLIHLPTIKPIDKEIIEKTARETKAIITVEEHSSIGGLGSAVEEVLFELACNNVIFRKIGISDRFSKGYGTHEELKKYNGIGKDIIKDTLTAVYKEI